MLKLSGSYVHQVFFLVLCCVLDNCGGPPVGSQVVVVLKCARYCSCWVLVC